MQHTKTQAKYRFCTFNLHSQINHLNFHRKKSMLVDFFPTEKIFFRDLISARIRFHDEFQALVNDKRSLRLWEAAGVRPQQEQGQGLLCHVCLCLHCQLPLSPQAVDRSVKHILSMGNCVHLERTLAAFWPSTVLCKKAHTHPYLQMCTQTATTKRPNK